MASLTNLERFGDFRRLLSSWFRTSKGGGGDRCAPVSHNFGTQLTLRADERPRRIVGATNILFADDLRDNVILH